MASRVGLALVGLLFVQALSAPTVPKLASSLAGERVQYTVQTGDTLGRLAARFGVDARTIARRNGRRVSAPIRVGSVLSIDAVHIVPVAAEPIVVNIPQRHLFVVLPSGTTAYPIADGSPGWPTPTGAFAILIKEKNPTWDVPPSIQDEMRRKGQPVLTHVPPSAKNPLGEYWMGLSLPGIGIHSTNAPLSIYAAVTHGCIRVHPERMPALYASVSEGMAGRVVYEPSLLARVGDRFYVEVHRDIYKMAPSPLETLRAAAAGHQAESLIDWDAVARAIASRDGVAIEVTLPIPQPAP